MNGQVKTGHRRHSKWEKWWNSYNEVNKTCPQTTKVQSHHGHSNGESNHASSLLLDIALVAVHGHQVPLRQDRAGVRLGHPRLADPDGAPWRPRWRWLTRNVADVAALAAAVIAFGDGRGPLPTRRGPQLLPVAVQEGLDQI